MSSDNGMSSARSWTPPQLAKLLHVSAAKVRGWIRNGTLGAINTATNECQRPQFVILEHHLREFEQRRSTTPPPKPKRKKRTNRRGFVDFFPD